MTKRICSLLPLLSLLLLIVTSCDQETKQPEKKGTNQSGIIIEAVQITEVQSYVDIIRNMDEYKKILPDQAKTEFIFSFDVRKMTINDSVYYHLELWKTRIAGMLESTIPAPQILAYFRIVPAKKQILVLDPKNKQFISLDSKKGKDCLSQLIQF